MNKTQAISRISEAKETDEIMVATFPCNICSICHKRKDTLFAIFFADTLLECCGACATKLNMLEELLADLLPEQEEELLKQLR